MDTHTIYTIKVHGKGHIKGVSVTSPGIYGVLSLNVRANVVSFVDLVLTIHSVYVSEVETETPETSSRVVTSSPDRLLSPTEYSYPIQ